MKTTGRRAGNVPTFTDTAGAFGYDLKCTVLLMNLNGRSSRVERSTRDLHTNLRLLFESRKLTTMEQVRFDVRVGSDPELRVDAAIGDTIFEVVVEPRDVRRFRAALMSAAQVVARANAHHVVLVLEEPRITEARLRDEWERGAAALRPEVVNRMSLAIRIGGRWTSRPESLTASRQAAVEEIVQRERSRQPRRSARGSAAHHEILRILLHHWLLDKGPLSIADLMKISGTSHPTVARAIKRFSHCLNRKTDRSVELRFFPRDEWARLVALSDDIRATVRFVDRSGLPRSPDSLLRRMRRLRRDDIAIGGVFGAKHYQPSLDLVGNPRLDVSVHAPGTEIDLSFVEHLDPALAPTVSSDATPALVVHAVHRAIPMFERDDGNSPWADPVECLLDLHEARLEEQALGFLRSFPKARGLSL